MKKIFLKSFKTLSVCFILSLCLFTTNIQSATQPYNQFADIQSCTNFGASFGDTVLFGNSEDGGLDHPLGQFPTSSRMFYYGADGDEYGCAFVGWYWEEVSVSIQGGMNDQGLCYDLTGIPNTPVNLNQNPSYVVAGNWVLKDVLRLNANVSEVIEFFETTDWGGEWWFQWLFADASGDVVIISPGTDGELVYTRKQAGVDGFLTQTNFNRANNKSGDYPCPRFTASTEILSEITSEEELTVEKFNEVLDAVHFSKGGSYTGYSNVFDPVNKMLYLTYMGQFDETVSINVTEELSDTVFNAVPMAEYFSEETVEKGLDYYNKFKRNFIIIYRILPISAIVIVLGGIIAAIYFLVKKLRKKKISESKNSDS